MKNTLYQNALRLIMVALLMSGATTGFAQGKEPYNVRDLLQSAESIDGETVRLKGFVSDVCLHKGCNITVHDLRDGVRSAIRVNQSDRLPPFGAEINGEEVVVTGIVRCLRIDAAYLDNWEADVMAGKPALNADGSDHSHGDVDPEVAKARTLRQIATLRQRIEQGNRGYLLSVTMDAERVQVQK